MKFTENLNEFNRRFADEWLRVFPSEVEAVEADDGMLCFRGPTPMNSTHIGTHVAVTLDKEVKAALRNASTLDRETMTNILIDSLGTSLHVQYDPNKIGQFALDIVGDMSILEGRISH